MQVKLDPEALIRSPAEVPFRTVAACFISASHVLRIEPICKADVIPQHGLPEKNMRRYNGVNEAGCSHQSVQLLVLLSECITLGRTRTMQAQAEARSSSSHTQWYKYIRQSYELLRPHHSKAAYAIPAPSVA